jgi:iron uptake system EfeUOB component EfeO/EfeM
MTVSPHDQLFPHDRDELARYRREAAEQQAAADGERQAGQRQATEAQQVAALRAEIAELRAYVAERDHEYLKMTETLIEGFDKIDSWTRKTIEARVAHSEAEMVGRISEKFGELRGWIGAIDPTQARAAKGEAFRFASEKSAGESDGEPVELPNPLPSRRNIN